MSGNDLSLHIYMGLGRGFRDARWGMPLAPGDLDLYGIIHFVVGLSMDDVARTTETGPVSILYDESSRFSGIDNRFIIQNTPGIPEDALTELRMDCPSWPLMASGSSWCWRIRLPMLVGKATR